MASAAGVSAALLGVAGFVSGCGCLAGSGLVAAVVFGALLAVVGTGCGGFGSTAGIGLDSAAGLTVVGSALTGSGLLTGVAVCVGLLDSVGEGFRGLSAALAAAPLAAWVWVGAVTFGA